MVSQSIASNDPMCGLLAMSILKSSLHADPCGMKDKKMWIQEIENRSEMTGISNNCRVIEMMIS
jgi:hypothetical protein